jgi:hypothetical protein
MKQFYHTLFNAVSLDGLVRIDGQIDSVHLLAVRVVLILFFSLVALLLAFLAFVAACVIFGLGAAAKGLHFVLLLIAFFVAFRQAPKAPKAPKAALAY